MQRRTLLKLGLGGSVVVALIGGGAQFWQPGLRDGRLTVAARAIFSAIGHAVLDGSLPTDPGARAEVLRSHVDRLDAMLGEFPAPVRKELSDLLAILQTIPGRLALAGLRPDWSEATLPQLHRALQEMRYSSLATRQQIYHSLRELTNAAFFSDPGAWPALGYPGPRALA